MFTKSNYCGGGGGDDHGTNVGDAGLPKLR